MIAKPHWDQWSRVDGGRTLPFTHCWPCCEHSSTQISTNTEFDCNLDYILTALNNASSSQVALESFSKISFSGVQVYRLCSRWNTFLIVLIITGAKPKGREYYISNWNRSAYALLIKEQPIAHWHDSTDVTPYWLHDAPRTQLQRFQMAIFCLMDSQ